MKTAGAVLAVLYVQKRFRRCYMQYVRKTYVEFIHPGVVCNVVSKQEIETRDVSRLMVPENAFAFKFHDTISTTVMVDGVEVELTSKCINMSPLHYYGGKVFTLAQLRRKMPDEDILIRNVERSDSKKVILCRTGNWQPFSETDVFVPAT
ncbi:MAG: hypothetical protein PHS79_05425 [Patescibacteria group bacterium]|nr:hypothetical protein [Patescibacteria group bacterium]